MKSDSSGQSIEKHKRREPAARSPAQSVRRPRPASGRRGRTTTSNCGAWTMSRAGRTDGRTNAFFRALCLAKRCVRATASSHSPSTRRREGEGRRGHVHHHAMEPSPLSNLSRLVPATEEEERRSALHARGRKGCTSRPKRLHNSCPVE